MKTHAMIMITITALFFAGCKSGGVIEFCEGVSADGKGVNCGTRFSTGEVTLMIKSGSAFGSEKITVTVFRKESFKNEKIETQVIDVDPEASEARTNYYFYDEGEFVVEVMNAGSKKVAEGTIQVVDVY